jgi:hypothetical protein
MLYQNKVPPRSSLPLILTSFVPTLPEGGGAYQQKPETPE